MAYTFISGATGGIGKAFVTAYAKRGKDLFLTARSGEKLNALKQTVESQYGVTVKFFACDLTKEQERDKMLFFIDQNAITFENIADNI